jgi:hypothetical protein
MKKLGQIREQYDLITEKEEAESRKLTTLVRAGLFDPKKLPMLKRALSKDAKDMTPAERKILIELLDSLMAEVLQSPQVYSKVKQSVAMKEEKDFEYEMARSELKALIADAQKILSQLKGEGNLEAWVQSKITKAADYISAASDNLEHSDSKLDEAKAFDGYYSKYDPRYTKMPTEREIPTIIILKRKAIRIYPDNQKVALYYSQALDKYVTIPFGTFDGGTVNEEIKSDDEDDNPYIAKSEYTRYKDKKTAAQIARMKGSLDKMKGKMARGEYEGRGKKSLKSAQDSIKGHEAVLAKAIDKAPKETVTKKVDLSKKNPSQLSNANYLRLMKGVARDPEMGISGRIGTAIGLTARRVVDRTAGALMKKGLDKVNTAFEETDTKSKFYAKRQKQLDEAVPLVLAPVIPPALAAARALLPHAIGAFAAGAAGKTAYDYSKKKKSSTKVPPVDIEKSLPAKPAYPKAEDLPKELRTNTVKLTATKPVDIEKSMPAKPAYPKAEDLPKELKAEPAKSIAIAEPQVKTPAAVPVAGAVNVPKDVKDVSTAAQQASLAQTKSTSGTKKDAQAKADTKTTPNNQSLRNRKGGRRLGVPDIDIPSFSIAREYKPPKDFTMTVKTSEPKATVRTGVQSRDTSLYRKSMQQNEQFIGQKERLERTKEFDLAKRLKLAGTKGNVRTGVDARDAILYRKSMQQNESVLQQLYSMNENEEKLIQIGNESVLINNNIAKKVIGVYESVNKDNKEKIEGMLNESIDSFKKILSFAARQ